MAVEKSVKETEEQKAARTARGKIMVSASAGAGKTTVMIERLADILQGGADADEILCVTFTKKAAANMKDKLKRALVKRMEECEARGDEPGRANLRVQLAKVNGADISTIDSFCTHLLRTYFYAAGIDSAFEVLADESEIAELKNRAMEKVTEDLYADGGEEFFFLLENYKRKRSDKTLKRLVFDAYDEVRIRPDYKKLLSACKSDTFTTGGFEKICAKFKALADKKCGVILKSLEEYLCKIRADGAKDGYIALLEDMRGNILSYVRSANLFSAPNPLTSHTKPRGKSAFDDEFSAYIKAVKARFKRVAVFGNEEDERQAFLKSGRTARAFIDMLLKFDEEYAAVKSQEGKLDYGDLEQLTYELLSREDGDVKSGVNAKYKYVFVDEYQDVNPIQDKIISLTADGDLFCVGDVKQAIYGFRGSRSDIFLNNCNRAEEEGGYVVLPDNFRSGKGVIDFVNKLFSRIMRPPLTKIDYKNGHEMRSERYPEGYAGRASFVLFENEEEEKITAEKPYKVSGQNLARKAFSAEGKAVLALVEKALLSTYYDADKGCETPVKCGDICVLTRKRSNKNAGEIVRALSSRYPVAASAEVNVCDRPEIMRLINVLSYIDNARQDVPLVSSLLSPLGNLTEEELAKIRLAGGDFKYFCDCAEAYAKGKTDEIALKLRKFFERVEYFKKLSSSIGAGKLIDEIVKEGFTPRFAPEDKQIYLKTFKKQAYTPSGELYLNAFLSKIKRGGYKILAPASVAGDCINVMTMHACKGLEFPVVIIADIAASFKGNETISMPLDDEFGFAPPCFNADRSYSDTTFKRYCRDFKKDEELLNEINLFYVACTRAKYRLYVLCSEIKEYDCMNPAFADNYAELIDFSSFDIERVGDGAPAAENTAARETEGADERESERIAAARDFRYPYELGITLPVKSSASKMLSERENDENAVPLFDEYADEGADTNPKAGIAYHRYLQLCDFSVKDKAGIEAQIRNFCKSGLMEEEQAELLESDKLEKILSMSVFDRAQGRRKFCEREFLCKIPAADYKALAAGEPLWEGAAEDDGNGVIVQGAIDLLLLEERGKSVVSADVIDYKYSSHGDEYLLKKYSPQLELYKKAVRLAYGLDENAVSATIVNIYACRAMEVKRR